ncbi:myosin light chain kinase family member 4-like [Watersipora subatra]|uniref:myosin light chain kinase family member 4-like n=1 Tax=Watersipora subatra TaxID=2589382 RepID=UPI00355B524E
MSRRKVAYAKKNCIDPEEEGEKLPFEPRNITVRTDRWVTKDFTTGEILGRGKFGEVKKCVEKTTGLKLAAKFIAIHCDRDKSAVIKEIELQSTLHHTKVLQLYDAFEKDRQMCIVMELVEGGELFDRVVDPKFDLTERVAILFMRQIVDGMSFIHSQHIIHLDMKPENIVCVATTGTRIKIIDFGLALRYDTGCGIRTMAGTLEFMAPEVANFEDVSPATDMWSVGVICYVLVSGLSPFLGNNDNETTSSILKCSYDYDAEEFDAITASCKNFISKLLVKKPEDRLTASECMKHGWLQTISRSQTTRHLSKKFHVKFFARRKWKKAIRAIVAMNRLERCSAKFMSRKSNTIVGAECKPIGNMQPKKPEPEKKDEKYDWRANLEARKKQRETDKSADSRSKLNGPLSSRSGQAEKNTQNDSRIGRLRLDGDAGSGRKARTGSDGSLQLYGSPSRGLLPDRNRQQSTGSPRTRRRNLHESRASDNDTTSGTRQSRLAAISGGKRI